MKMAIQSTKIMMNPARGDLSPKKAADHNVFRTNWMQKRMRAFFTYGCLKPLCHTRKNATPMSK